MLMIEKQDSNNKYKIVCSNCHFIKDNVNLTKQLGVWFKRSVCSNNYKSKVETKNLDNNNVTRFPFDASFQGASGLFVLAYNNTNGNADHVEDRKYFLPRVEITNYNVLIDGRNFYNQLINDKIKQYDEIRKKR